MKILVRVLFVLLAVVVLAVGAGCLYLFYNGRQLISQQLERASGRPTTLESFRLFWPPALELGGVQVKGMLSCVRARLEFNQEALLGRKIVVTLLELDHPVFFLERTPEAELVFAPYAGGDSPAKPLFPVPVSGVSSVAGKLLVREGEIRLHDQQGAGVWILSGVNAQAFNLPLLPVDIKTDFSVTGSLAQMDLPFLGSFVKGRGWINFFRKDMDAVLQTVDDNGHESLDVHLLAQANDLAVSGKVRLNGKQQKQSSGVKAGPVENVVLSLLEASETEIEADISFTTRLDRFEVGPVKFKGKVKTGLQSDGSSGNIVDALKELGAALLKDDASGQSSP
jgi:hypothetical protein